jgi:hypothetical protein
MSAQILDAGRSEATNSLPDEERWPAVEAAYLFVLPSYQFVLSRFEAADTRLMALLTLAATMTLGAPVFAKAVRPDISFASPFLWLGVALFAVGAVFGLVGRIVGTIILPDPMVMYEKSLRRSDHSFKMSQIFYAGENFSANVETIREKGNAATVMTITLVLEVLAFILWLGL